ncbi:YqaI family protein [Sutcliffiella halmapala]
MLNLVQRKCWECHQTFTVREDEEFDVVCPNGCYEKKEAPGLPTEYEGDDACGDEIRKGDYILVHNGEIILESNAIDYLVDILGAKRKIAGEEE